VPVSTLIHGSLGPRMGCNMVSIFRHRACRNAYDSTEEDDRVHSGLRGSKGKEWCGIFLDLSSVASTESERGQSPVGSLRGNFKLTEGFCAHADPGVTVKESAVDGTKTFSSFQRCHIA